MNHYVFSPRASHALRLGGGQQPDVSKEPVESLAVRTLIFAQIYFARAVLCSLSIYWKCQELLISLGMVGLRRVDCIYENDALW